MVIDFGNEIGLKKTSAQLIKNYLPEELVGKQVAAVTNFPPKQIGKMISEVLVLGFPDDNNDPIFTSPNDAMASPLAAVILKTPSFAPFGNGVIVMVDELPAVAPDSSILGFADCLLYTSPSPRD